VVSFLFSSVRNRRFLRDAQGDTTGMSNDLLFSVLPRRGTVPVKGDRGEVKKIVKKMPLHASPEEENLLSLTLVSNDNKKSSSNNRAGTTAMRMSGLLKIQPMKQRAFQKSYQRTFQRMVRRNLQSIFHRVKTKTNTTAYWVTMKTLNTTAVRALT
jgi:hypothetical protein